MHLVCPKCATSYQLDAASIGGKGRSVRCARCKNVWHAATPELRPAPADAAREEAAFRAELGADASAEKSAADAGEPKPQSGPDAPDRPPLDMTTPGGAEDEPSDAGPTPEPADPAAPAQSEVQMTAVDSPPLAPLAADAAASDAPAIPNEPEDIESVAARRMPASAAAPRRGIPRPKSRWPLAALAMVAICASIIGWRKDIVRQLPQMASFYGSIGLPVNVRGLVFTDVRIANETHDGVPVLTVEGKVASVVSTAVDVPRLRFALRNATGHEVYSWTAMPAQTVLEPGQTLPFRSRLASPPGEVHDVQVRFFNRRDAMAGVR